MRTSPEAIAVKIKLRPKDGPRAGDKHPLFSDSQEADDEMPDDTEGAPDESGEMGQMVLDAMQHRDPEALEEAIRKIFESCSAE